MLVLGVYGALTLRGRLHEAPVLLEDFGRKKMMLYSYYIGTKPDILEQNSLQL